MKLVDLLVRELPDWPDSLGVFTQDKDKEIYFYEFEFVGCEWDGNTCSYKHLTLNELSQDHETAIVTKEQWQAARMKEDDISD